MAYKYDNYEAKDDISCAILYFREPRKLLICSGPPYDEEKDKAYWLQRSPGTTARLSCAGAQRQIS
ncbi:MAG: hypothetical protein MZV63_05395 [Marinilabiliales bacterium]|nr:hypothetical protein [Marinilabiliales bacterium]